MRRTMRANGDAGVYQYAEIEAQRGDHVKALEWLEKSVSLKQGASLKELMTDPYSTHAEQIRAFKPYKES